MDILLLHIPYKMFLLLRLSCPRRFHKEPNQDAGTKILATHSSFPSHFWTKQNSLILFTDIFYWTKLSRIPSHFCTVDKMITKLETPVQSNHLFSQRTLKKIKSTIVSIHDWSPNTILVRALLYLYVCWNKHNTNLIFLKTDSPKYDNVKWKWKSWLVMLFLIVYVLHEIGDCLSLWIIHPHPTHCGML